MKTKSVLATVLACVTLTLAQGSSLSAELTVPASSIDQTNSQEALRAYLQLQEQLHETQMAIERLRKEGDVAAAENAKALAARLQAIEQTLSTQRAQELEALQNSNRVILIVAGIFAMLGFLAMVFMAYFQWRTVNRLAELSTSLPTIHGLGPGPAVAALGPGGDTHLVTSNVADGSNARLLSAIDQLDKRIRELEYTAHPSPENGNDPKSAPSNGSSNHAAGNNSDAASQSAFLLGKGQSLLNLDKPDEALACFEEILSQEPSHTEALVKKGTALERLRRPEEALACYDQAIGIDGSLTMAYLCKGGLCNRLERFNEALECYEKALRTQEKARA